jgi:hypothetical protein
METTTLLLGMMRMMIHVVLAVNWVLVSSDVVL